MPSPAVSHCTSPRPKRAVAPSESEWSMKPWRTNVTVSKPRCGCCGKPGHDAAVVHAPAVGAGEVHADVARRERGRRAHVLVRLGIEVEVVHAEQERIDGRPLEAERDGLQHGIGHGSRLRRSGSEKRRGRPEGRPVAQPPRRAAHSHRELGVSSLRTPPTHPRRRNEVRRPSQPVAASYCSISAYSAPYASVTPSTLKVPPRIAGPGSSSPTPRS